MQEGAKKEEIEVQKDKSFQFCVFGKISFV
jgi:hypothetical protein